MSVNALVREMTNVRGEVLAMLERATCAFGTREHMGSQQLWLPWTVLGCSLARFAAIANGAHFPMPDAQTEFVPERNQTADEVVS